MPSRTSSLLDLMVTMSCGLTMQICLSLPCHFAAFLEDRLCQWPSLTGTQGLYTQSCVLKERWWEERTGSSSLNFLQAVFTHVVVESSQPPAAESMSPTLGGKRKLPPPACQVDRLPSIVCRPRGVQFPCTVYICNYQGPLSGAWAHCISCAPSACSGCRRCCCCPLQCDTWHMVSHSVLWTFNFTMIGILTV